jgi:hypothetical protein
MLESRLRATVGRAVVESPARVYACSEQVGEADFRSHHVRLRKTLLHIISRLCCTHTLMAPSCRKLNRLAKGLHCGNKFDVVKLRRAINSEDKHGVIELGLRGDDVANKFDPALSRVGSE